jgi:hypothetical protein
MMISITTLGIKIFNIMTLSIMKLSIMTFSIMELFLTLSIKDFQHKDTRYEHKLSLC